MKVDYDDSKINELKNFDDKKTELKKDKENSITLFLIIFVVLLIVVCVLVFFILESANNGSIKEQVVESRKKIDCTIDRMKDSVNLKGNMNFYYNGSKFEEGHVSYRFLIGSDNVAEGLVDAYDKAICSTGDIFSVEVISNCMVVKNASVIEVSYDIDMNEYFLLYWGNIFKNSYMEEFIKNLEENEFVCKITNY